MGNKNKTNVLLVEILMAVLFFMLSALVLVRVFATSKNMTVRSGVETAALTSAQNVAETIIASDDPDAALADMQFVSYHGAWTRDYGEYTLYVNGETEPTDAGELWDGEVAAYINQKNANLAEPQDTLLFSLPCALYKEVRP